VGLGALRSHGLARRLRPRGGYNSVFNNYDPNGGPTNDMQLPSNSPYKGIGFGDGLDLGANVPRCSLTLPECLPLRIPYTNY